MNFDTLRTYLGSKPGAIEDTPFGPGVLVLKVGGKMFALISLEEDPLRINLKCEPEKALALRDCFTAVIPGYHMNKRHWNTVILDGSISDETICSMIDDSHALVVKGLPKTRRP